ncbi:MAG TPA: hypothetical protein VIU11_17720 [Nakamurella sp.]
MSVLPNAAAAMHREQQSVASRISPSPSAGTCHESTVFLMAGLLLALLLVTRPVAQRPSVES